MRVGSLVVILAAVACGAALPARAVPATGAGLPGQAGSALVRRGAVGACRGDNAVTVVRSFYSAVVRESESGQLACMTPALRRSYLAPNAVPEWRNVLSLRITRITRHVMPPRDRPGLGTLPFRMVQVVVQYVVRYRRVIDSPNGAGLRFIYVVQMQRGWPWRILGIGSGP